MRRGAWLRAFGTCVWLLASAGCAARLSAQGESCARTADCVPDARCVQLACVASAVAPADLGSLEGLGRAVVDAVASGHSERLSELVLADAEAQEVLRRTGMAPEEAGRLLESLRRARATLPRRWAALSAQAEAFGVELSKLRFVGLLPYRVHYEKELEELDGDLGVRVAVEGRGEFVLDVEHAVRANGRWRLTDPEVELERLPVESTPSIEVPARKSVEARPRPTDGAALFVHLGCNGCHGADGAGSPSIAPPLRGIAGQPRLTSAGTVVADETYLRTAIEEPQKMVVSGYSAVMPSYQGVVSEDELKALVRYLQGLTR